MIYSFLMIRVFEKGAIVWLGLGQFGHGPFWASLHLLKWKLHALFCFVTFLDVECHQCSHSALVSSDMAILSFHRCQGRGMPTGNGRRVCHSPICSCQIAWSGQEKKYFGSGKACCYLSHQPCDKATDCRSQSTLGNDVVVGPQFVPHTSHTQTTSSILPILDLQLS